MEIRPTEIPDVKLIIPKKFGDHRGFFSEVYTRKAFEERGLTYDFVQDNHSHSGPKFTMRGLHFQLHPNAQDKLVRVTKGSVLDVAVDIRRNSSTFGQHVSAILSAENWHQLLVPIGFAHGFCTLEEDTEVIYKVTSYYSQDQDRGLLWTDPALGIQWPCGVDEAVVSDKDRIHPLLSDLGAVF